VERTVSAIAERIAQVRERIERAARDAGRDPGGITLVAVSKKHPADAIRAAYAAGQRDFGENYAQELSAKRAELADLPDIRWHFIGALQSNKARFVVPGTVLVHSVDRMSVAEALAHRATLAKVMAEVLVEVNVGGEETKAGVTVDAVPELLRQMEALPRLAVRGLMCIPPPVDEARDARPFFQRLQHLEESLRPAHPKLVLLSMGMTSDFEVAIAEGATHVRVGTAIFGPRE
jgi:pyridoxal phosphate enzyme (YggS family)